MIYNSNIDLWEGALNQLTPKFKEMLYEEECFLLRNITPGNRVIDLGCGTGRNVETVLIKTPYALGVDSDSQVVDRFNFKFEHLPSVYAKQGSVHDLSFCDENTFDVAVFFDLLTNLEDLKLKSFIEISRVLKKSGILLLSTYAETALQSRLEMYKVANLPISSVHKDGVVVFEIATQFSLNPSNTFIKQAGLKAIYDSRIDFVISEQFSLSQLKTFGQQAGLTMISAKKVGDLAYLVVFQK